MERDDLFPLAILESLQGKVQVMWVVGAQGLILVLSFASFGFSFFMASNSQERSLFGLGCGGGGRDLLPLCALRGRKMG